MVDSAALNEGERWSRKLLADLRTEEYVPSAWVRFLGCSFERAEAIRACRPALAGQARRSGIAGAVATAALARVHGRSIAPCLAWWCACWTMLDWHLGMVEGPRGESRSRWLAPAAALAALVRHLGGVGAVAWRWFGEASRPRLADALRARRESFSPVCDSEG